MGLEGKYFSIVKLRGEGGCDPGLVCHAISMEHDALPFGGNYKQLTIIDRTAGDRFLNGPKYP